MQPSTQRSVSALFEAAARALNTRGKRSFLTGQDKGQAAFQKFQRQFLQTLGIARSNGEFPVDAPDLFDKHVLLVFFSRYPRWSREYEFCVDHLARVLELEESYDLNRTGGAVEQEEGNDGALELLSSIGDPLSEEKDPAEEIASDEILPLDHWGSFDGVDLEAFSHEDIMMLLKQEHLQTLSDLGHAPAMREQTLRQVRNEYHSESADGNSSSAGDMIAFSFELMTIRQLFEVYESTGNELAQFELQRRMRKDIGDPLPKILENVLKGQVRPRSDAALQRVALHFSRPAREMICLLSRAPDVQQAILNGNAVGAIDLINSRLPAEERVPQDHLN